MTPSHIPVILLASRDPQLAYLIQRYAGTCGCQLLRAEYGESTSNAIAQDRPDMILVDVSQANAEGRLVLRELKSQTETRFIPIILCATSEMDWLDYEAEGRLLQPIMFNEFINVIKEIGIQIPSDTKEA